MSFDFKAWAQQATTGAGFATILGTVTAAATSQMSWTAAAPVLVGGLIALIWPENKVAQQSASNLANDVLPLIPLLIGAFQHGQKNAPAPAQVAPEVVRVPPAA
jgi:hypothetical protein